MKKMTRLISAMLALLICMSTALIKQHSVLDAAAAVPVCLLAEGIAYGGSYWRGRLKR